MASTFAFFLVLGILVDDALVIGESVHSRYERGIGPLWAAVEGTRTVAVEVFASVATTMAAFAPLLFMTGAMGKVIQVFPVVVCGALAVSFVDATLILPAHLGHSLPAGRDRRPGRVEQPAGVSEGGRADGVRVTSSVRPSSGARRARG